MHMLFDIFVLPPLVIAGVVFVAMWNVRDAIIAFRVAFFACPVCGFFILSDRGPEVIALLFAAIVFAIFWSRMLRLPPVYYASPSEPSSGGGRGHYSSPSPPAASASANPRSGWCVPRAAAARAARAAGDVVSPDF
jgi:hypothetical protein